MKRSFCIALILALLGTTVAPFALADEAEVIVENVEATQETVEEIDDALLAYDGESEETAPEKTAAEAAEESPAEDTAAEDTTADAPTADAPAADDTILEDATDGHALQEPAVMAAAAADETDEAQDTQTQDQDQAATGLQLSASSLTIAKGETYTRLAVTPLPEGSEMPAITWRSDNKKIATVNKKGEITGVKAGKTTVYAKIAGTDTEVACKVKVKKAAKKIAIKPESLTLGVNMCYQLTSSVPSGYASGLRKYSSSNKKVATVDADGVVTAVAAGSATITVKTFDGKASAKCKLTVADEPASISFPDSIIPLAEGQTTSLNASALTKKNKATPATLTYAIDAGSPDPGCVTLDAATGAVTGVRAGEAIITATAHNGVSGRCVVEVDVGPKTISLNSTSISIGVKEEYVSLMADLVPPDGSPSCAQVVTWSSSNKKIAKIDAMTGAITGVKVGKCKVTVTAPNGVSAKCTVKVLKAPKKDKVSISPENGSLKVGQSGKYNIKLSSGYGGSFTYESSNTDIATIDNSGIVTAIAPGKVVISVTTYNGIKKTANLEVLDDNSGNNEGSKTGSEEKINYVIKVAKKKKGCKYVYGAFGPNTFDCSGFVYWCFKQVNIKLKDSAYRQGYDSRYKKIAYSDLKPGDLVFFNTVDDKDLSDHSGLYLGNGKFIHCSSSAGEVIISKMNSGYYKRNFSWGRRVIT